MRGQVVLRHPSSLNRRQPLLAASSSALSPPATYRSDGGREGSNRFGEVAGGTTAECAVVCCCCPCALVNFLVLTVYKVPAGLCRKALQRKRRQRMKKKGLLPQRSSRWDCTFDDTELQIHPVGVEMSPAGNNHVKSLKADKDVLRLEEEMWDRFHGTGFWRSPSQRTDFYP